MENKPQRATILTFCKGDWEKQRIPYFAAPNETEKEIREMFNNEFTSTMVSRGPLSFPSRNWIKSEQSPIWMGRLELVHQLFSQSYVEMLRVEYPADVP